RPPSLAAAACAAESEHARQYSIARTIPKNGNRLSRKIVRQATARTIPKSGNRFSAKIVRHATARRSARAPGEHRKSAITPSGGVLRTVMIENEQPDRRRQIPVLAL